MPLPKGCSLFYRSSKKRWVLSYADPVRGQPQKVLPKEITRQRDAETWANEWLRAENLRPDLVLAQRHDEGMTVAQCAAKWLHLRERDERIAPATLDGNQSSLHNWILPRFGTQALGGLEVPELRAFLREIRGQRAGSTVRNIYYTFSTMYSDAMAEGWINASANVLQHPAVQREIPDIETHRTAVRIPLEWAAKLINGPMVELEWRARYAVAFTSGARDGEIAGLRWHEIDFDNQPLTFRIEQSVAVIGQKNGIGFAKPKATKTKQSKRTMPLHAAARDALLEWREYWTKRFGRAPATNDYVFPGTHGKPARPRSAHQLRQHLEMLGLPTEVRDVLIDFKATRSSFASWLADAGVPDQIRKRLMGHAVRDVTEWHYTARDIEQL
ncbi:MAG TPA: tyrosine-type recombinase/integrase, partial [Polyangium sp.]|nr:tyrosine-type recombinase/integrase [Polyangium sp.]